MYGKNKNFQKGSKPYLIEKFAIEHGFLDNTGWGRVLIEDLEHEGIKCTGNGCTVRPGQGLYKKYKIEKEHDHGTVIALLFKGYQEEDQFNQTIRKDISEHWSNMRCVFSGFPGTPSNPIEVDHKNGLKNETRLNDLGSQEREDFQSALKNINDAKRQYCRKCKETRHRPSFSEIFPPEQCAPGFNLFGVEYTHGDSYLASLTDPEACKGCYLHDPVAFLQDARNIWFNNKIQRLNKQ